MVGYSKIEDRGECLHEQTAATKRTLTQQEHNDTYLLMIQCSMATCGTNQMRVAGTNTTGDGRHKARTVAIPKRTTTCGSSTFCSPVALRLFRHFSSFCSPVALRLFRHFCFGLYLLFFFLVFFCSRHPEKTQVQVFSTT